MHLLVIFRDQQKYFYKRFCENILMVVYIFDRKLCFIRFTKLLHRKVFLEKCRTIFYNNQEGFPKDLPWLMPYKF